MQINPFVKLLASQPHLLVGHVEAYADLAGDELKRLSSALATRIGLFVGAGFLALLGIVWGGIALMLRGSLPAIDYPAGWLLWAVPLLPLVLAVVLVLVARSKTITAPFAAIKRQVQADLDMVREVNAA